jgi:monoamine oxidase
MITHLLGTRLPGVDLEHVRVLAHVDWGLDPLATGAFSYPRQGHLDAPMTWREVVGGTLFFAGEATCAELHPAMVHGALESGMRAAAEVEQHLTGASEVRIGP